LTELVERAGVITADHTLLRAVRRLVRSGWIWLLPALFVYTLVYAIPIAQMFWRSIADPTLSLGNWHHLLSEPVYAQVLWLTVRIAVMVTACCVLFGYPIAYMLTMLRGRTFQVSLVLVLLPFWISAIVRNYAWVALLSRRGVVNSLLMANGLIEQPLDLMFNETGVVIAMTYVLLPLMILSLYSVMHGIEAHYLLASASLGAGRLETFWRVFFPLSLSGIWAGSLLVFITAMGFYITPIMLGGGKVQTIAVLIDSQVSHILNWGMGSALGAALLIVVLLIFFVFDRLLGVEHLLEGRR
jgi:putative spermidine/putrescine transport system permease protein